MFGGGTTNSKPAAKPKALGVNEDKLSTNEQARPIPYFAGKRRIAVTFVSDVFDTVKHAVTVDAGKKPIRDGTSYFTSFVALISHGALSGIHGIVLNNESIWPIADSPPTEILRDADNSEFVDITIPDYGLIRIYWGTETQERDDYTFFRSGNEHPPYKGMAYMVAHQLFMGINQTNVQNLEVIVSRYPELGTSPAQLGDDANPANILYELMTHPRFGRGLGDDQIDLVDMASLGAQLYSEKLGISPLLNDQREASEWLMQILEYIDGYPKVNATTGTISFGTIRPSLLVAATIDESLMVDPINLKPADWSSTFSQTNVRYSNPNQNYDADSKGWRDRGNFQITGELNSQTLDRLWITNPQQADFQAAALGRAAALPAVSGTLTVRRTPGIDALIPGDAITLSYAPRAYGDLRCRIQSIEMPDPARPQLSIEFKLDRTYLLADLAVDGFFSPASVDAVEVDQIAAYSLVELPAPLCAEGRPSLGVLAARPSVLTSGFTVHLGQNYDSSLGLVSPTSFDLIGSWSSFALHGAIAEDYPLATEPIDVTTGMTVRLDGVDLEIDEQTVFSGLSDTLLVFAGTEIMSVVRADLVGIATYRLMLSRAQFGSIRAAHAAAEEVFIVFWSDLLALRHLLFEPFNVADVKLQASTGAGSADISLAPEPTLTFAGRVYAEPGPLNLRVGGNASAPTYGTGADLSIEWSVGDSGTLPWRLDAVTRTSVLRFYDATGVTLLGTLSTAAASATVLNAALIAILGSEVTFQLTVEITSESNWWTLTSPVTPKLTVTKV